MNKPRLLFSLLFCFNIMGCAQDAAVPPHPAVPGTPVGDNLKYDVKAIYSDPRLGIVSELVLLGEQAAPADILVIGGDGFRTLDSSGSVKRSAFFHDSDSPQHAHFAKAAPNHLTGYRNFVANVGSVTTLYDMDGQMLWGRVSGAWTVPIPVDVAPNSAPEIAVAEGVHGVSLYSLQGQPIRRLTSERCSNIASVSLPNQPGALIAMNLDGPRGKPLITFCDRSGAIVSRWESEFDFYEMGPVTRLDNKASDCVAILAQAEGHTRIILKDVQGRTRANFEIPEAKSFAIPRVFLIRPGTDDSSMVLLASSTGATHAFAVYVLDSNGAVRFHYSRAEDADSLVVYPIAEATARPVFLVGTRGCVLRFTPL